MLGACPGRWHSVAAGAEGSQGQVPWEGEGRGTCGSPRETGFWQGLSQSRPRPLLGWPSVLRALLSLILHLAWDHPRHRNQLRRRGNHYLWPPECRRMCHEAAPCQGLLVGQLHREGMLCTDPLAMPPLAVGGREGSERRALCPIQ